jgi:GNAT superfamily N-acetyltransferase
MAMDKIIYEVPPFNDRKVAVHEALINKLYVKNFCLEGWYMDALTIRADRKCLGRPYVLICMAYDNGTPIGVCFVYDNILSVYVKPTYRRQGIGRKLTETLLKQYPIQGTFVTSFGIRGSVTFYDRIGLTGHLV